jgi:hypothetical protein
VSVSARDRATQHSSLSGSDLARLALGAAAEERAVWRHTISDQLSDRAGEPRRHRGSQSFVGARCRWG